MKSPLTNHAAAFMIAACAMTAHGEERSPNYPMGVRWDEVPELPEFGPRFGMPVVEFNGQLLAVAGFNWNKYANDAWMSDDAIHWRQTTEDGPFPARNFHTLAVLDDRAYIMGGAGMELLGDVWFTEDGSTWELATADAPWEPRSNHTTVVFNDRLWVIGGHLARERRNDVWSSADGIDWRLETADAGWHPRSHHTSVVFDDKIFVIGGAHFVNEINYYTYLNDVWASEDGVNWTEVTRMAPWAPRYLHKSFVYGGLLYIFGGDDDPYTSSFPRDVWVTLDGAEWDQFDARHRWERRNNDWIVEFEGALWMIAGNDFRGGSFTPREHTYVCRGFTPVVGKHVFHGTRSRPQTAGDGDDED